MTKDIIGNVFLFLKNSSGALSQVTPEAGGAPKISTLATPPHTSKHYTQHIHHMMYMCLGRFTYRIGYLNFTEPDETINTSSTSALGALGAKGEVVYPHDHVFWGVNFG